MLFLTLPLAFAPLTDWHVDVQGTAPGSGTLADPYTSIEYAIAQATTVPGDRILVAPGTYTGETIDFLGKELSIEAAQGPGTVTVEGPLMGVTPHLPGSGGQALIRVVNGESAGTQIVGLSFTRGAGEDRGTDAVGGVLYMVGSQLTLMDCALTGSAETRGGVAYLENSALIGTRTQFDGFVNNAQAGMFGFYEAGGALWAVGSELLLVDCDVDSGVRNNPGTDSIRGYLLWLEDCNTTLQTTTLSSEQACNFSCRPNSIVHAIGGSLQLEACSWSPGSVGAGHTIHATGSTLTLTDMTWATGGGPNRGRALMASGCNTTIQNCQFLNSPGSINDMDPWQPFPGGQIAHGGELLIENCFFTGSGHVSGGALSADSVVVRHTTFQNNYAKPGWSATQGRGGAIYAGTATIENCVFTNNEVWAGSAPIGQTDEYPNKGGALYLTGPSTIRDCNFTGNNIGKFGNFHDLKRGGAIYAEAPIRIFDCEFTGNYLNIPEVHNDGSFTQGGALYLEQGGYIENSSFTNNAARLTSTLNWQYPYVSQGGAIFADAGILAVKGCVLENNSAEEGAGIYVNSTAQASLHSTLLRGNWLAEYTHTATVPSGAAWFGPVQANQCTITEHDAATLGGQVIVDGSLDSCIYWGNVPAGLLASVSTTHSTVEGRAQGLGNSTEDPLFWAADDFHLLPASPAIDAGNPALFDDDGSRADRGAYAFDPAYCGTLCAQPLGSHSCDSNPNSSGATATIAAFGSADVSDQFLTLSATQVPENSIGYFLTGQFGGFVPLFNGSAGNLCLGGQIYRMHDTLQTANAGSRIGRRVNMMDFAYGNVILPGSTWHFQFWFRDHGSMTPATNTSGSVQIQF